ncbi:MAG: hypothetical protein WBX15_20055 [Thermoanaerobaculia bacterium]
MRRFALIPTIFFILLTPSMASAVGIEFSDSDLIVTGVTPGGSVSVFGEESEPKTYWTNFVRKDEFLSDADADGVVRLEGVVLPKSVWVAVDLTTGDYAVASPPGFPLQRFDLPGNALEQGAPGQFNKLRKEINFAEIFWCRPGVGAWKATAGDDGETDEDGAADGKIEISPAGFTGPSPAPQHFQRGDVIALIHPYTLQVFVTKVGR